MRWLLRSIIACACIFSILLVTERYFFSCERAQLFAWWFFSGNGDSPKKLVSQRVKTTELESFKNEISDMLQSAEQDSLTQQVALNYANEFIYDAKIKEQLIVIAFDHPNALVRCKLRRQLGLNHEVIMTAHSENSSQTAKFSLSKDCK